MLHHAARRQSEERPEALALSMGEERMTYGELELRSARLAYLLRECGCRRGDRVALLMDKAPETIVAMLASLRAGCAYVPVDVGSPPARLERILRAADPRVFLVGDGLAPADLKALEASGAIPAGARIGRLGAQPGPEAPRRTTFTSADLAVADGFDFAAGDPGDPAHILFTSGSTGEPKGVVISHSNVLAFLAWAIPNFGIDATDRLSGQPPLHFDLSTFDVFGAFHAGASLHLVSPALAADAHRMAEFIRSEGLTQWFSVPSVLTFMARFGAVRDQDFPELRRVLWCGEVLSTAVLRHWMTHVPHPSYTNLYGPTEATIASSHHAVVTPPADDRTPVPIGHPCDGEELLVLDDERRPVATGTVGQLYIAGPGLSPGYWRDAEKTRAAFALDPRDAGKRLYRTGDLGWQDEAGIFHFVGRVDSQIKSRGYRIELGEIEAALHALDDLAEAAVVAVSMEGFEGHVICCAFVPSPRAATAGGDGGPSPADLRRRLSQVLPAYMLPTRWRGLERLPKNLNGKVDRVALRDGFASPRAPSASSPGR